MRSPSHVGEDAARGARSPRDREREALAAEPRSVFEPRVAVRPGVEGHRDNGPPPPVRRQESARRPSDGVDTVARAERSHGTSRRGRPRFVMATVKRRAPRRPSEKGGGASATKRRRGPSVSWRRMLHPARMANRPGTTRHPASAAAGRPLLGAVVRGPARWSSAMRAPKGVARSQPSRSGALFARWTTRSRAVGSQRGAATRGGGSPVEHGQGQGALLRDRAATRTRVSAPASPPRACARWEVVAAVPTRG